MVPKQTMMMIVIAGGVGILLLALKWFMASIRRKLQAHVQARFNPADIIGATTRANFLGVRSKGGGQIRGNGALVLTREQLFFVRAVPLKEFTLPLESIREVTLPRSFNGKSVLMPLLCVHYGSDGVDDAMAWALKDPQRWKKAIETAAGGDVQADGR